MHMELSLVKNLLGMNITLTLCSCKVIIVGRKFPMFTIKQYQFQKAMYIMVWARGNFLMNEFSHELSMNLPIYMSNVIWLYLKTSSIFHDKQTTLVCPNSQHFYAQVTNSCKVFSEIFSDVNSHQEKSVCREHWIPQCRAQFYDLFLSLQIEILSSQELIFLPVYCNL